MVNNTLTLSEKYSPSSFTSEDDISSLGYILSLELKRNKLKGGLVDHFNSLGSANELAFLEKNSALVEILPSMATYIKDNLKNVSELHLKLFDEGPDWQTLFINIHASTSWETSNKFVTKFLKILYKDYKSLADKINIRIIPNEF